MLEMALARFKGDKAKAARYIGWSPSVLEKTPASLCSSGWTPSELEKTSVKVWGEAFRRGGGAWLWAA
jgi:hypothetical protein